MNLFLIILNMSITASLVAFAVIIVRFFLRRAPKIFSYILWTAVAIRLLIPVSFTSSLSMLGFVKFQKKTDTGFMEFIPQEIGMEKIPVVDMGIKEISHFINSSLPVATPMASANPMQIIVWIGSLIWFTGIVILVLFSILSYLKIVGKIRTATLVKDNIYETDQIDTPFVCGFLKPKIYIPIGMSNHERSYILLHEKIHILRRDYLIKPFAFMLLIIHWFNPLMWLSYALMSKDMEMSCDESVVNKMGHQIKGSYSTSLLTLSVSKKGLLTGSPLAFGESDVKARIKNILTYRQPSKRMVVAYILIIITLVVGCIANPKPLQQSLQQGPWQSLYSGYHIEKLMKNKTLYVGNFSKVGGLLSGMPAPTGLEWNGMALQTTTQPYGVTLNYLTDNSVPEVDGAKKNNEIYYRNSILLLSLIDNVDSITYSIDQNDGIAQTFTFTREQIDKLFEEDIRHYATDETTLRQLIDQLKDLSFSQTNNTPS